MGDIARGGNKCWHELSWVVLLGGTQEPSYYLGLVEIVNYVIASPFVLDMLSCDCVIDTGNVF
jgi:hypothetical protein